MKNPDEKQTILYVRNVSEELLHNIEDLMERRKLKTRNAAVRSMIEDYPKALSKIQELKTEVRRLEDEIYEYKDKMRVIKEFKTLIDSL